MSVHGFPIRTPDPSWQMPALSPQETDIPRPILLTRGIRRLRRLEREISALNAEKSAIYKELRADGFEPKIVRRVMADLRLDAGDRRERDELQAQYMEAYALNAEATAGADTDEQGSA